MRFDEILDLTGCCCPFFYFDTRYLVNEATARARSTPCFAPFVFFFPRLCLLRSVSFRCALFGCVPCSELVHRFLGGGTQVLHKALAHPTSRKTYVTIVRGSGEAFAERGWFTASVCCYSLSVLLPSFLLSLFFFVCVNTFLNYLDFCLFGFRFCFFGGRRCSST